MFFSQRAFFSVFCFTADMLQGRLALLVVCLMVPQGFPDSCGQLLWSSALLFCVAEFSEDTHGREASKNGAQCHRLRSTCGLSFAFERGQCHMRRTFFDQQSALRPGVFLLCRLRSLTVAASQRQAGHGGYVRRHFCASF